MSMRPRKDILKLVKFCVSLRQRSRGQCRGVDGERFLRKVEGLVGRTWDSRERSLRARRGLPHFHQGGERKGEREQVEKGGCGVVTRDRPTLVPGRGTQPELGHGQVPGRKGQPAA